MIENYKYVCPIWTISTHRKFYTNHKDFQRNLESPSRRDMKIGIIGAGAAGLAALKHSLDEHHECEVFEKTGLIGGTWNYTDKIGLDEFGLPIHSSMYQGLKTNLPKELMQFEGYPFTKPDHSYITQPEVLEYINGYATHFNLYTHIKFFRHVIEVCPLEKGRWSVEVQDLKSKAIETREFDAIFVCIGNYSVPCIPKFQRIENFKGTVIHSHDFRKADAYKNRKVLVIGGGPSGIDIARLVKGVTDTVYLSTRSGINPLQKALGKSWIEKSNIKKFDQHSVRFTDDTEVIIDDVILCTGYLLSYPFLTQECGIEVEDHWVKYLYKHIINVNRPTMAFIGIPYGTAPFIIFGIQVILCHRSSISPALLPDNIATKPVVQSFNQHSVVFVDGSKEVIDDVILCTGYLYSYPFLSKECEIDVDDKWVKYLYKQIININHPTMGFIGIPFRIFPFVIFGIQVRFFLAYLMGKFSITKEKMLEDLDNYMNKRKSLGISLSQAHCLGIEQGDYMEELAVTANIRKIPPVYIKMYKYAHNEGKGKKNLNYKIVNNEEFEITVDCDKT